MNGWLLRHPEALLGWIAVAYLFWRLRRTAAAQTQWTGALSIWKRVPLIADEAGTRARERRALPWSLRFALGALALGVLALADPIASPHSASRPAWSLVLDRSPSMFLPVDSSAGAPLRIAAALERALELCERQGVAPAAREWRTCAWDGVHSANSARPPTEWLSNEWASAVTPPWSGLDSAGVLWISDCEPPLEPLFAGLALSGAAPIPGVCADLGLDSWTFDGEQLRREPWGVGRAGVVLPENLPADVASLARLWARSRGLPVVAASAAACLTISPAGAGGAGQAGRLARESWASPASSSPSAQMEGTRSWARFESGSGPPSAGVSWRPGKIFLAVSSLEGAAADPAAFALDWSQLFEAACLPDPALVPLAARLRAGPARSVEPAASVPGSRGPQRSLAALLSGLAGALVLAALALGRRPLFHGTESASKQRRAATGSSLG